MMIEVKGLSKRFGSTLAVDNVSFTVHPGEIVGFLGPNGAGKSTTMKILTCYLAPTSGTASIAGHDILEEPVQARSKVGYLPENTPLYEEMPVLEFLDFMAKMRGVPPGERQARIDELVETCDIGKMAYKDIGELSKGYRQRVGLAQALLHDPPVLILDEPTSGLDPAQIVEIRELIKHIAREKSILLSTHILPEAQNTCNRILIISEGRIVGEGTSDELLAMATREEHYSLTVEGGDAGHVSGLLKGLAGVTAVSVVSANGTTRLSVTGGKGGDLRKPIFDLIVANGLMLLELSHSTTSLEDVFLRLTGGTGEGLVISEKPAEAAESRDAESEPGREGGDNE